jgi:hypothetical protein
MSDEYHVLPFGDSLWVKKNLYDALTAERDALAMKLKGAREATLNAKIYIDNVVNEGNHILDELCNALAKIEQIK